MATDFYTNEDGFIQYTATEDQTRFDFDWYTDEASQIKTYLGDMEINESTVWINPNKQGGYVTLAPQPAGTIITIRREQESKRVTNFTATGYITADLLNKEFDNLARTTGQVQHSVERSLHLSEYESQSIDCTLPTPEANKSVRWNSQGDALESVEFLTFDDYSTSIDRILEAEESCEEDALISATNAMTSIINAQLAQDAADSVVFPIPVGDGLWVEGKTFNEYPEYMVYNEIRYTPIIGTALPYTVGATPDLTKVKVVGEINAVNVVTASGETLQDFIDSFALKIFQSPTNGGLTEIQTRTAGAGEVYEVRKTSDNSLATIYSDAAGTIEIAQDGTSNVSGSDGVVEFYIADGDYYIEVGLLKSDFSAGSAEKISISEVKKLNFKNGTVVTTSSYYSKDELSSFGLSAPYGGGARYLVVPSAGLVEDTVKYHQMDNGLFLELLDVPNSRNAGFVGNYVDELNKGFDNAEKLDTLNSLNESLGGANRYHAGDFYVSDPTLELTCDSRGEGNKATKFYIDPPSDNIPIACIKIADNCTVRDIEFNPSSTDSTKTWIANKFSSLFAAEFEYNQYLYGMNVAGNCVIIDCVGKGFRRGLQGVSGTKNVSIIGGEYWGADWGTSFYNVELLSFDRVTVIGGNIGGMGMPSCRHVTVGGNCIVYNPNGTGINTGGSSAEGFNAEDINIASCTVYARDCINLENGCVSAKVSGYKIYVITEIVQNGVGVGVFSRADNSGGLVGDIHIGPGFIEGAADGNGTYSHAVKVGYLGSTPDSSSLNNVSISGVSSVGSRIGIESIAPTNTSAVNVAISGNSVKVSQTAVALTGKHVDSSVSGGSLVYSGDTTIASTYGVRFDDLVGTTMSGVKTQGFGAHYRQDGAVLTSYINSPTYVRGADLASVTKLSNTSGVANMPINNDITV